MSSPHLALGLPVDGDSSDDRILDRKAYVVSYNDRLRGANWVAWKVTPDDLGKARRTDDFRADRALAAGLQRVTPSDYQHSGYDQGHLCPSSHRSATKETNSITFLMTNMQPQLPTLNRGPWSGAEAAERDHAASGKVVFVVAGGVFSRAPKTIGRGIAIPKSSFRVTVVLEQEQGAHDVSSDTTVYGVMVPNDGSTKGHKWTEFRTSVDEVEVRTGYDFLRNVEDGIEAVLESKAAASESRHRRGMRHAQLDQRDSLRITL